MIQWSEVRFVALGMTYICLEGCHTFRHLPCTFEDPNFMFKVALTIMGVLGAVLAHWIGHQERRLKRNDFEVRQ